MDLKNFKARHKQIWIVGLLTFFLITATTLFYTLLKIIRLFFAAPETTSDTVYIYQGGIMATLYLTIALFLLITALTRGKFAEWLLDQKGIALTTFPRKFVALVCVFAILAMAMPKLIRFATKEPMLSFNQNGITLFKEKTIPWDSIESISQGRFQFRHIAITLKNGDIIRITEPDMYDTVPEVLKKISMFTKID